MYMEINIKKEGEAPGHDLEPRFCVNAYFHIDWSKYIMHVLKKDVLLLCA